MNFSGNALLNQHSDINRTKEILALAEKYPLQLIGWHSVRLCHSIHDSLG